MSKLNTLTLSMLAVGMLSSSLTAFSDTPAPKPSPSNTSDSAAVVKKLNQGMAYWNTQMYQKDSDFANILASVAQYKSQNNNKKLGETRDDLVHNMQNFNKQVMSANQYVLSSDGSTHVFGLISTPSGSVQNASALLSSKSAQPFSYMDLLNSQIDMGSQPTVVTSSFNCIYGFGGTPEGSSETGVAPSTTDSVTCDYHPTAPAVNYIHNLAGYGLPLNESVSGQKAELSKLSPADMTSYRTIAKSLVAARSVGEGALLDLMQGNLSFDGKPSIVELNKKRYTKRADSVKWHAHVAGESMGTVLRQQAYMMADIEKELNTMIQLQRKQYALAAMNEMQLSNLVMQNKLGGVVRQSQGSQAAKNLANSGVAGQ